MDTVHENIRSPDYTPDLYLAPEPIRDRVRLGIHVLIGKLRLPQPSNASGEGEAQYCSLWAFVRVDSGTLSYDAFNAAVSTSANTLISLQDDGYAVTVFHPIGKYILYHPTSPRVDVRPGEFVAPMTSLMTFPSTRRHDGRRPVWFDYYIHSPHPPSAASTSHESEVSKMLERLDTKLGDGPDGKNTLHLGEIPGSAPDVGVYLTVFRQDWACAIEMSLLLLELNGPSAIVQAVATRCGDVRPPSAMLESYQDLLRYLAEKLYFSFLGEFDINTEVGRIASRDHIGRPENRPGFLILMQKFVWDRYLETIAQERALMAQDEDRDGSIPGVQQFPPL